MTDVLLKDILAHKLYNLEKEAFLGRILSRGVTRGGTKAATRAAGKGVMQGFRRGGMVSRTALARGRGFGNVAGKGGALGQQIQRAEMGAMQRAAQGAGKATSQAAQGAGKAATQASTRSGRQMGRLGQQVAQGPVTRQGLRASREAARRAGATAPVSRGGGRIPQTLGGGRGAPVNASLVRRMQQLGMPTGFKPVAA